ncbi:hypothetical protein [Bosea vaviloviae]|nr:hypothetical protein [Bosea vaviloviae]
MAKPNERAVNLAAAGDSVLELRRRMKSLTLRGPAAMVAPGFV